MKWRISVKGFYEFSEFLIDVLKVEDFGAALNGKATYHDSCAGLRECKNKTRAQEIIVECKGA